VKAWIGTLPEAEEVLQASLGAVSGLQEEDKLFGAHGIERVTALPRTRRTLVEFRVEDRRGTEK
jgi:hypothetical protein